MLDRGASGLRSQLAEALSSPDAQGRSRVPVRLAIQSGSTPRSAASSSFEISRSGSATATPVIEAPTPP
jgi:hypothetical protein